MPLTNSSANFGTQILGIVAIGTFVSSVSLVLWLILKHTMGIRASEEDELVGLDKSELGLEAYPEFGQPSAAA